ncbi:MAG: restriction endonuclease subunit S [Candidatus Marinimicrobia bacterium]|nr:restriction endonuclease subunit S [Candidatus Neomarinimicrobiota bacterium]
MIDNVQVGATREALTKAMIEQFEIPVPPLAEQKRIVARVDELMALVDELETQLAASRAAGAKLLAALIAELTAGKVPHATASLDCNLPTGTAS